MWIWGEGAVSHLELPYPLREQSVDSNDSSSNLLHKNLGKQKKERGCPYKVKF